MNAGRQFFTVNSAGDDTLVGRAGDDELLGVDSFNCLGYRREDSA